MEPKAGVPETTMGSCPVGAGFRSKGQDRSDRGVVLDLRSGFRRDPVAQAFVGSNPTPRTNSRSLALSSIRTIPPANFQATDDAESSFCFGGFLVRSYLGRLDCVEVNRVGGSWNLEAFR